MSQHTNRLGNHAKRESGQHKHCVAAGALATSLTLYGSDDSKWANHADAAENGNITGATNGKAFRHECCNAVIGS